jgi:glycosyltransferase involved in cell wall biosynthesis
MCRWGVARADLSLLKGTALMSRYGAYARHAKEFHDTSFYARDIVQVERLERRLATLAATRALRVVYCGRLTERKGLRLSLEIVARAIGLGAQLQFDVIGSGPERSSLEQMAASLGIADHVSFIGALPYDASLISRLGDYDALLFTPTAEDTPRMIFDGYAAGLPVIASGIPYVEERHRQEHAAIVLPPGQVESSATAVAELCRTPQALIPLSRAARKAAEYHSAESWYSRRAQWTMEAAERRQRHAAVAAAA